MVCTAACCGDSSAPVRFFCPNETDQSAYEDYTSDRRCECVALEKALFAAQSNTLQNWWQLWLFAWAQMAVPVG